MSYRLGVDVGGTFTDVLLVEEASGETWRAKTASTPSDQAIGVLNGIGRVCADAGISHEAARKLGRLRPVHRRPEHARLQLVPALNQRSSRQVVIEVFRHVVDELGHRHESPVTRSALASLAVFLLDTHHLHRFLLMLCVLRVSLSFEFTYCYGFSTGI